MSIVGTVANEHTDRGLLGLVFRGLESHGFNVRLPSQDDGCTLTLDVEGVICDLLISEDGYIEWDCGGQDSRGADPRRIADVAELLLTGHVPDPSGKDDRRRAPDMTFLGIVGLEAKARGLDTELKTYEDQQLGAVTAEIMIKNPASVMAERVRVSDAPGILWEKDFWLDISDDSAIRAGQAAELIITRIVPVIPLAQAAFTASKASR